jgi:hypothetical protein
MARTARVTEAEGCALTIDPAIRAFFNTFNFRHERSDMGCLPKKNKNYQNKEDTHHYENRIAP